MKPCFDIGANLAHESFAGDLDSVVQRAQAAGVGHIAVTGSDLPSSRFAADRAKAQPEFFTATAGLHPHLADTLDAAARAELTRLAALPEVSAVGETGLDYFRNLSPKDSQIRCCEMQLQLACELNKPVFLHQRQAHSELLAMVRQVRGGIPAAVLHCFTDTQAELTDWLELDLYIGITGWICDERRGRHLRDLVRLIPAHRLLLETDAPYLLPRDMAQKPKGRRNEPAFLPHIYRTVARCRGESEPQLRARVWQNSLNFFALGRRPTAGAEQAGDESGG